MSKKVYVQDKNGDPLMPTKPAKAKHMLNDGRAEVVQRSPFTIQLTYEIEGEKNKQEVELGLDPGYTKTGFSAKVEDKELINGTMDTDTNVSDRLTERRKYRKNRRNRNTRYREPRFDNRKRDNGWLAPSIQHRLDMHRQLVDEIKKILPVDKVVVEVAKFDQQKIQDPEIEGVEYQHGTLQGYNVKHYLLEKFDYQCVYCGAEDVPLEVEHIVPDSRGGTDRVDNLTISCHDCNQEKGDRTAAEFGYPEVQEQTKETLKETAFMNQVRWQLTEELDAEPTYGHVTKKKRKELDLKKSHVNDAFVIAGADGTEERCEPFKVEQRRRNNRKLQLNRSGFGRSVRKQRYPIQPGDTIKKNGQEKVAKGTLHYGQYVRVDDNDGYSDWKTEDVKVVTYGKGLQFN